MLDPCDSGQPFTPYRVVIITSHANEERTARLSIAGIGADDVKRRMAEDDPVSTTDVLNMFDGWMLLGWEAQRLTDEPLA